MSLEFDDGLYGRSNASFNYLAIIPENKFLESFNLRVNWDLRAPFDCYKK